MKSIRIVNCWALLVAIWVPVNLWAGGSPEQNPPPEQLVLGSLRSECTLEKRWVGAVPDLPWGTWLKCGNGEPMLVSQPRNLLGKVKIDSQEAALDFVRFFSSPYHHEMFRLEGMLEIRATPEYWGQDIVEATSLGDRFQSPTVTVTTRTGFCFSPTGEGVQCERREFTIERLAAFYDNNIYEIVETVSEDGFYSLVSKSLVLEDLSQHGLLHLPPH